MKRILVTGATGQVGSAVISALHAIDDIIVRAGVRDVAKDGVKWRGDPGLQPVAFDFLDRVSQDVALADCDTLFLLRPLHSWPCSRTPACRCSARGFPGYIARPGGNGSAPAVWAVSFRANIGF